VRVLEGDLWISAMAKASEMSALRCHQFLALLAMNKRLSAANHRPRHGLSLARLEPVRGQQ
jgi:hypothetical protein